MPRDQIISDLKTTLNKLGWPSGNINLEHPAQADHGDYSTNIAMVLFGFKTGMMKKGNADSSIYSPLELAQKIVENFPQAAYLEKVEAVAPGFINFWIKPEYLYNIVEKIIKEGETYGQTDLLKGKKIMVEFAQPNPFKEFHIGHLRNISLGESACRLFEELGAEVKRVNYEGDVGMHVAKSIWGLRKKLKEEKITMEDLIQKGLNERIYFMGQAYSLGSLAYEDNKLAQKKIREINQDVYKKTSQKEITKLYALGKKWSLEYFETIYKRLGTKFAFYYFESAVGEYGVKIVKEYLRKGVFEESEGAVVFKGEKYGLHTRVFLNSLGLPTYEAKDLGLPIIKYDDFSYDSSIIQTGNEQAEYFKVMLAALTKINPDLAAKTRNQTFGMVNLKSGKMSSRTGQVVTANWLLDEVKKKLQTAYKMENETAEVVAVGAVKYSMLKVNATQDIAFEIEESINLEGDSGPYLQYTYARTRSVLAKAKSLKLDTRNLKLGEEVRSSKLENQTSSIQPQNLVSSVQRLASEELSLLRALYRFPEIVESAGKTYSPNLLCGYLFDLAGKFNSFYNKCSILQPQKTTSFVAVREMRLKLTAATGQVLKNGLYLLGIKVIEKM